MAKKRKQVQTSSVDRRLLDWLSGDARSLDGRRTHEFCEAYNELHGTQVLPFTMMNCLDDLNDVWLKETTNLGGLIVRRWHLIEEA